MTQLVDLCPRPGAGAQPGAYRAYSRLRRSPRSQIELPAESPVAALLETVEHLLLAPVALLLEFCLADERLTAVASLDGRSAGAGQIGGRVAFATFRGGEPVPASWCPAGLLEFSPFALSALMALFGFAHEHVG